jgi:ubiquinone/menaquinone biosynthesis C-methylase UbiE
MTEYIADRSWSPEQGRLAALARALDPSTRRYLDQLGLSAGMRCLEVGAGAGSIACYLAERVGDTGVVVATDLDTALLEPLRALHGNLTVEQGDIAADVPRSTPAQGFDLAHARLVLGHIAARERALANMVKVVRPGGWLLLEECDFVWTDVGEQPLSPTEAIEPYYRVWTQIVSYMRERGYAVHWGRKLAHAMREAGLEQVQGEALALVGNRDLAWAMALTIERFGAVLVREGRLTAAQLSGCLGVLESESLVFTGSPTFSLWGRRPD